ncbi:MULTISPECIES: ribose-5-phosphate isomerase RpiA [unclassified Devosia]|uniref:ribose-5-phosphate isomerase RpiA n=1 Tax=unclassified Devosia TaxID=196773 RepID=UPI000AC675AF|nr:MULTISPECIES: ribose-5-phosphate isomerase RpiA [unclassified Devosia]MBN9360256.1 ribose-5-phosphate isomerase RpiA [Devosia sp.]
MSDEQKYRAAEAAMAEVTSGMRLGLGTGSTAKHFVDIVGRAVQNGLDVICVPTSEVTAAQALSLGIPLTDLETTPELDLTVDGADELGPGLALIKGGGGALLREKIVAAASRRMIVIADQSKKVEMLGRFPLPIEVNHFGLGVTTAAIAAVMADFNAEGELRRRLKADATPFVTDGGHAILDAFFGRIPQPEALARALADIPGVVEHGLFIGLCQRAYVAGPAGIDVLDG